MYTLPNRDGQAEITQRRFACAVHKKRSPRAKSKRLGDPGHHRREVRCIGGTGAGTSSGISPPVCVEGFRLIKTGWPLFMQTAGVSDVDKLDFSSLFRQVQNPLIWLILNDISISAGIRLSRAVIKPKADSLQLRRITAGACSRRFGVTVQPGRDSNTRIATIWCRVRT